MRIEELVDLFNRARRRCLMLGESGAGVLIGLDLEGRIYAFHDGNVIHRTNPDAVLSQSHAEQYHNPGGDGFWPAPEGSCFGYFYSTGAWRVPPGLTGARYRVLSSEKNAAQKAATGPVVVSKVPAEKSHNDTSRYAAMISRTETAPLSGDSRRERRTTSNPPRSMIIRV